MRHTFEEDDRSNDPDSETDSSVTNSFNECAEDTANDPDSRFHQKIRHFHGTKIRRVTPPGHEQKNLPQRSYWIRSEFHTKKCNRPHTFWLTMSSLDVGLGVGDDMVKAFDKQTQTAYRHSSMMHDV